MMQWWRDNWKRVAKWGGLGAGCLLIAMLSFVLARYVSAGATFEGELTDLAPAQVSAVVRLPSAPVALAQAGSLLDQMGGVHAGALYASSWWREGPGQRYSSIAELHEEALKQPLEAAREATARAGLNLFEDIAAGEILLCADFGPEFTEFVALTRVSRATRFRWLFLDVASGFLPRGGPGRPTVTYRGGVLTVQTATAPGEAPAPPLRVTLLDNVMVATNSTRLMNAVVSARAGAPGLAANAAWRRAHDAVATSGRAAPALSLWLDLDRMRGLRPDQTVDGLTRLPANVIGVFPDVMSPLSAVLEKNLDTRPFESAWYTVDAAAPGELAFSQHLLVSPERRDWPEFKHLRDTWAQPAREAVQLRLLPPDTMLLISYRQPLETLYQEVLDERGRQSLVGDFLVAMRARAVRRTLDTPPEELMLAVLPAEYAPEIRVPLAGQRFPLPAFVLGFRVPGARPEVAGAMLEEYLQAQRGRDPDAEGERMEGAVSVIQVRGGERPIYGFMDPRESTDFVVPLNNTIRAALAGEWLLFSNSERALEYALRGESGEVPGLATSADSPWRALGTQAGAAVHVGFGPFVGFATGDELVRALRESRYNPSLIEGRLGSDVRREIAGQLGLPLDDERVDQAFAARRAEWERVCRVQGDQYEADLRRNLAALRLFENAAVATHFSQEVLSVHGVLRLAR
jgi:hypothetical protein